MTPMQELTDANLNPDQYVHFTGLLAVALDNGHGIITSSAWSKALRKAKEYQS